MLWLDEAAGVADAGSKAETLARARRAGLPTVDGFVVMHDEEIDPKAIAVCLARLGGERFAVRSSADLEDRPGLSAAGVFASLLDVPAGEVPDAIERVRASAHGEPVRAYLGARGLGASRVRMSVLVQPMVRAARVGVLHTAPVEENTVVGEERLPGQPEWGEVRPRRVRLDGPLGRSALRLAALVGGEADIEYAIIAGDDAEDVLFLQARPLTAPPSGRDMGRFHLEPADAARVWLRDAEHNPDPLSAAQASLVEMVERHRTPRMPRQRVLQGYLYYEATPVDGTAPSPIAPEALPSVFASEIEPACAARLAPLEEGPPDPGLLDDALSAYVEIARRYFGEVSPSLKAARRLLDDLLRRSLGEPLSEHAALLAGTGGLTLARDSSLRAIGSAEPPLRTALLARHLERYGAYSPAWDVAMPPDDEAPERVLAAAALVARGPSPESRHAEALAAAEAAARLVGDRMNASDRAELFKLLPTVRAAFTLVEDDDALFFRAQRAVRRPLLALGRDLAESGRLDNPEQIFSLPIDEVRANAVDAGRARGLRALQEAARRKAPPDAIRDGVPTWRGGGAGGVLTGLGTSGRAWGRAYPLLDPSAAPTTLPPGAILVTPAILPSITYLLPGAAALITDHGGALSHAATLAREYGVPAVLGTGVGTRSLRGGEELLVDGDAGKVYRLGGG